MFEQPWFIRHRASDTYIPLKFLTPKCGRFISSFYSHTALWESNWNCRSSVEPARLARRKLLRRLPENAWENAYAPAARKVFERSLKCTMNFGARSRVILTLGFLRTLNFTHISRPNARIYARTHLPFAPFCHSFSACAVSRGTSSCACSGSMIFRPLVQISLWLFWEICLRFTAWHCLITCAQKAEKPSTPTYTKNVPKISSTLL